MRKKKGIEIKKYSSYVNKLVLIINNNVIKLKVNTIMTTLMVNN